MYIKVARTPAEGRPCEGLPVATVLRRASGPAIRFARSGPYRLLSPDNPTPAGALPMIFRFPFRRAAPTPRRPPPRVEPLDSRILPSGVSGETGTIHRGMYSMYVAGAPASGDVSLARTGTGSKPGGAGDGRGERIGAAPDCPRPRPL